MECAVLAAVCRSKCAVLAAVCTLKCTLPVAEHSCDNTVPYSHRAPGGSWKALQTRIGSTGPKQKRRTPIESSNLDEGRSVEGPYFRLAEGPLGSDGPAVGGAEFPLFEVAGRLDLPPEKVAKRVGPLVRDGVALALGGGNDHRCKGLVADETKGAGEGYLRSAVGGLPGAHIVGVATANPGGPELDGQDRDKGTQCKKQ